MNLVLLGSGRVATVLGRRSVKAGHRVVQVFGRNKVSVEALAGEFNANPILQWNEINCSDALLYLVCLPDAALPRVAEHWQCDRGLVVHTAGSVARDAMKGVSANYGVLWPLQSVTKQTSDDTSIPLLVDANTPDDTSLLFDFATTLSPYVKLAGDDERRNYHVAAVAVNNFTNHLYRLAFDFLEDKNLDAAILHPLIMETAQRVLQQSPAEVQTGPALRGDAETMASHLEALHSYPQLSELYLLFSSQIAQLHRL